MENSYENIIESAFWTLDPKPNFQNPQEPHKVPIFEWLGWLELQVLLGSSGLLSSNASESQAALSALETAMRVFPKQFFPQFLLVYIITLHLTPFASCSWITGVYWTGHI
jgi:hypothetical protein